jgi:hypothetical protein
MALATVELYNSVRDALARCIVQGEAQPEALETFVRELSANMVSFREHRFRSGVHAKIHEFRRKLHADSTSRVDD